MKNKSRKTAPRITFQEYELVEITDPAEQAALDRRILEAEKRLAGHIAPKKATPRKRK